MRLNHKYQLIFALYFGLEGKEETETTKIAEKFNVTRGCIWQILHKSINQIKQDFEETQEERLFKYHLAVDYSEENYAKVNDFLNTLPNKERKIFVHYFGLNGAIKLNMSEFKPLCSSSKASKVIKNIINNLNSILKEPSKEN